MTSWLILIGQCILTHHSTYKGMMAKGGAPLLRLQQEDRRSNCGLWLIWSLLPLSSSSCTSSCSTTLSQIRWRSWMHLRVTSTRCRFEPVMRRTWTASGASGAPWWTAGRGKVGAAAASLSLPQRSLPLSSYSLPHTHNDAPPSVCLHPAAPVTTTEATPTDDDLFDCFDNRAETSTAKSHSESLHCAPCRAGREGARRFNNPVLEYLWW